MYVAHTYSNSFVTIYCSLYRVDKEHTLNNEFESLDLRGPEIHNVLTDPRGSVNIYNMRWTSVGQS